MARAKVLLLGAPLDAVTVLHYAEAVARIRGKRWVTYWSPKPGGSANDPWIKVTELDTNGLLDVFAGDDKMDAVETMARAYLREGRHVEGTVNRARCFLFDAHDIVAFGVEYLESHFG